MKTAVITGASRGIGKASAEIFLKNNWKVIGTSTSGKSDFEHENLVFVKLDLTDQVIIEKAMEKIISFGKIDVLVNNAGVALDSWDEGVNMGKVRQTFEVNLFGLIDFTEKLLPAINNDGHIVNLSSRYGSFSMPIDDNTSIGYRMAKASLNMYTRFLSFCLVEQNIIVSSLDPGWVKTDMGIAGATEDAKPDREPTEPAQEVFNLVTSKVDSGFFWHKGEKRDW